MSAHGHVETKPADDPAFKLPESLAKLWMPLSIGGLIALVLGVVAGMGNVSRFAMSAYLTAYIYCWTIVMGCMFFVLIQHLVRAGWSVVVRRVAELIMMMIIPLAFLFIPILASLFFSDGGLYVWDTPSYAEDTGVDGKVWETKTGYLTQGWFAIRAVIYFAIWIGLALYYFNGSTEQDETGEKAITDRLQYWSGPALMLFSLSMSFAAFDWVMSLAPMWFSTMFGVYMFAGGILSAHCAIAATTFLLQKKGALRDEVTVEHYHDLGKLIFGFIFFWTYISFSQYMLIWYGNIPEETEWIYHRHLGAWGVVGIVLIFMHWLLPFLGTMSVHVRRRPYAVCAWSVYILCMHFLDVSWMIMPESGAGHSLTLIQMASTILCLIGMVAFVSGIVLRLAGQTKVAAVRDPRLGESIAFENI